MNDIGVIIPTFNRGYCISRAIESIRSQTHPVSEIIIVDDCSTDDTENVVRKINDSRICYLRLAENKGAAAARNYGVAQTQCDIIAFHDSDDEWLPEKMERQLNYSKKHPEYGLIYSAYTALLSDGIYHIVPQTQKREGLEGEILVNLLRKNTIGAPSILLKKSVFDELGGFDEKMRSLEDWDFVIRAAQKYPIGFIPEALVEVHISEGGISSSQGSYYESRCYMLSKHQKTYQDAGLFDAAVKDLLEKAAKGGILEQVKKMLLFYLTGQIKDKIED